MTQFLEAIRQAVWGVPTLVVLMASGTIIGIKSRWLAVRKLPCALGSIGRRISKPSEPGTVSPVQALCTALGTTVGTGNIAGVAGAISLGGPGALFWMLTAAVLGMGLKYTEVVLAVRFREQHSGSTAGGPMYYLKNGLGQHRTARLYALLGLMAAMGVGSLIQVNSVAVSARQALDCFGITAGPVLNLCIGIGTAALLALVVFGGAARIGSTAELLIPAAAMGYIALSLGAVAVHREALPDVMRRILVGAFCPQAVTGGAVGTVLISMQAGLSRGVFSNEAGVGTASIAHAGTAAGVPVEQGLLGIVEVFIDTVLICTLTGLVILTAPLPVPYGEMAGAELTVQAFSCTYGRWISVFLAAALAVFSFATILGWGLYGYCFAEFLWGRRAAGLFRVIHIGITAFGAAAAPECLWNAAEITNALMLLPNLQGLLRLEHIVREESDRYFRRKNAGRV